MPAVRAKLFSVKMTTCFCDRVEIGFTDPSIMHIGHTINNETEALCSNEETFSKLL